jgi:hypothetical protein
MRLAANYLIRIPVVIHVLYNTASQNISDAQIQSQLDALNRDFRRKNADTVNTPDRFKPFAADVQIEFFLATADPKGKATNGIIRKQTSVGYWQMDDKIKYTANGGDDAWDSRYYLNIWIGNTRSLLGYSSAVGGPADKDGIVINTTAFGTINMSGPYDNGRTVVHEVGHWLGLKHIWGDTYCGDDGVDDTPKQGGFTTGCPTGFRTSCSNGDLGDMYMNYMDFTNDACLNLFTKGQAAKMRGLFEEGGARYAMLASRGLNQPWLEEAPIVITTPETTTTPAAPIVPTTTNSIKLYPNPSVQSFVLEFEDASWIGKEINIINLNGVSVQKVKLTAQKQTITISHLARGVYFVRGRNGDKKIMQKLVKL